MAILAITNWVGLIMQNKDPFSILEAPPEKILLNNPKKIIHGTTDESLCLSQFISNNRSYFLL